MQDFPSDFRLRNKSTKDKDGRETEIFAGFFSHLKLTDYDKRIFLQALRSKNKSYMFDFLASVLSTEDFLLFLDLFAGDTLNFPARDEIYYLLCDSQIYGFLERKDALAVADKDSELPTSLIQSASMAFASSKNQVQKSYNRVKKLLTSLESSQLLDLNSLKSRKKSSGSQTETEPEA